MYQPAFILQPFLNINNSTVEMDYIQKLNDVQVQYQALFIQNQELKKVIQQMKMVDKYKRSDRKKYRRVTQNLQKNFKCPYSHCCKQYASDLAVNLHIKNKHNGGTKTIRQAVAKNIILAEEKGEQIPKSSIDFPPGYLKAFKKKFFNQEQNV